MGIRSKGLRVHKVHHEGPFPIGFHLGHWYIKPWGVSLNEGGSPVNVSVFWFSKPRELFLYALLFGHRWFTTISF
jgi:hypothetical protein